MRFSPGPFVPAATLKFEHLVLALGGVVDVSRVPGMPEHGYLMKTVGDAIRLRVDLIQRLEEASLSLGEHLQKRGIEVRLNSRVAALTAERAILDTGEVIETNTV